MTALPAAPATIEGTAPIHSDALWRRVLRSRRVLIGGGLFLLIFTLCIVTLPFTLSPSAPMYYDGQVGSLVRQPPAGSVSAWFGYDTLGRSIAGRCLLGGAVSLMVGAMAALIAVVLGTTVGLISGYSGGWVDAVLMRFVDVMYGLPYILLVILFKIALEEPLTNGFEWLQGGRSFSSAQAANLTVMFLSIGLVSWLTMARVVRGQVLSLREMPFIEACHAIGLSRRRVFLRHVLPNLIGPITVYATLTVPSAILQESFLSFLGVGVRLPLPTWGSLASEGVAALSPIKLYWWMLLFPCLLLMITLLCLNFLGDGLRDLLDPKRDAAKL
jgi:ABC-type dipeptide/oligopeptide/nickel transport system permease subunit